MPLSRGARLGPYRIDAEIGAGGMGHVFRATDMRLERAVAIKLLPVHRWADPELRHRLEREARALSALNHPNLCALYDVGELVEGTNATPYLVMELLEGDTLRDRLAGAPISVRRALQWGAQIASGLAAAHDKGVIHRDLKPENIIVTAGDLLKVLDFGLAREMASSAEASTLMRTQTGFVMGTAEYMSPEQARGQVVGPQSDIFSLGIVLFEMLTGRAPFQGGSSVETMNAILVAEPPTVSSLAPNISEAVDALISRCLEKDPQQRFSSARDLAYALDSASRSVTTSLPRPARKKSRRSLVAGRARRFWVGGTALVALALIGAAAASRAGLLSSRATADPPRLQALTYSGRDSAPAAAPDGRLIAFVSTRDGQSRIWLKSLADGTEVAITSGPDDSAPRFSPDGALVYFTRSSAGTSAIHRVAVLGGEPRSVIANAFDADPSPDGSRVAFIRNRGEERTSTLLVARADGGGEQELAASGTAELTLPRWSRDGRWLAVSKNARATAAGSVLLVDVQSGEQKELVHQSPHSLVSGVTWVPGQSALLYLELDEATSRGLPRRRGGSALVLHELHGRTRVLMRHPHGAADSIDLLPDGRVLLTEDVSRQNLQEVMLDGSRRRWVSRGMSVDRQPAYGRGGRSVVFTSDRGGNVDLWEIMLDTGALRRITDHESVDWDPHVARDGSALYWSSDRGGHFEIWRSAPDGASPQQMTRDGVDAENPSVPAAHDWIYYDSTNPKGDGLWRQPLRGGAPRLVTAGETMHPEVSADGRHVLFQRPEGGHAMALDVVRVTDGRSTTLVSNIIGLNTLRARWMGTTSMVAYRALTQDGRVAVFAQEVRFGEDTRASRRLLVDSGSDGSIETFAISPDGQRAIIAVIDEASAIAIADGLKLQ